MRHSWKRKRAQASHTDDWLMTYADMITLLLCFFAIFLSVSIPKKDVTQKAHIAQPVEYPPDILEGNLPFHGSNRSDAPASVNVPVTVEARLMTAALQIAKHPVTALIVVREKSITAPLPTPDTKPAEPPTTAVPATENTAAVSAVGPTAKPPASLSEIVDRLKAGGPADIEQKGDRITTLQMNSAAFFDSGSAALSVYGKAILQDVAVNIKSDKFKGYQVTVEGHTDDKPISTPQFPSNWELSTARAAAVVHFFLEQGIPAQKLRAAGYADTFPVAPNRDASGKPIPANQARNRRVVINLEKIDKAQ